MISPDRKLSLIVAASENNVIGRAGGMPWQLSADLRRFKAMTMGHHIVMGRTTYESIGRLLPGRTSVIVTRQKGYQVEGAVIVHSIDEALSVCQHDDCPFITGGAQIYSLALPYVTEILMTRVHASIEDGDTFFPEVDWQQWKLTESTSHMRDKKNSFDYTFERWLRK